LFFVGDTQRSLHDVVGVLIVQHLGDRSGVRQFSNDQGLGGTVGSMETFFNDLCCRSKKKKNTMSSCLVKACLCASKAPTTSTSVLIVVVMVEQKQDTQCRLEEYELLPQLVLPLHVLVLPVQHKQSQAASSNLKQYYTANTLTLELNFCRDNEAT
jgi:hypothetical protein